MAIYASWYWRLVSVSGANGQVVRVVSMCFARIENFGCFPTFTRIAMYKVDMYAIGMLAC